MALRASGRRTAPALVAAAVAAGSLIVYALTAARLPWWGDSAEFVTVARTLGIAHPPGYPLYTILAALAVRVPIGSPFLRLSLLSAAFASLAAGIAALTVWGATGLADRRGLRRTPIALRVAGSLVAGFALAFSQTFWSQATVPEVYSLSALLVLVIVFLTVVWLGNEPSRGGGGGRDAGGLPRFLQGDRPVYLVGVVLGLALAHHLTAVLIVPPVLLAMCCGGRRRPSPRALLGSLALLALGLTLYAYLPIRAARDPAVMWSRVDSLPLLLRHVTGAQYAPRLFDAPLTAFGRKLLTFVRTLPRELPWFVLILSGVGFWSLRRRARGVLIVIGVEAILVLAHAMNYWIRDIQNYYVPIYAMLTVAAGVGLVEVVLAVRSVSGRRARTSVALGVVLAVAAPAVQLPVNWSVRDLSRYRGAATYLDRMLDVIAPGGIVIALNDRTVFLLWYARFVEQRRTDISIVDFGSLAPHVEKWFPGVRLPTDEELSAESSRSESALSATATREWTPVASYLPLLISLNVGASPIYADPEVAARRMPLMSIPRGLLAEIVAEPVEQTSPSAIRTNDAMWLEFLSELTRPGDGHPATVERYAKSLADQGRLLLERGETEDAVPILETAARLAPGVPHIRNNLGAAYERAGRVEEALGEYRRAIDIDPGSATSYRNVYVVLRNRGDLEQAQEFLQRASRLDRGNVGDLLDLAVLSEQLGRPEEAEALFRQAQRLEPESWEVEIAYADFLSRRGRYADALALYRRAEAHAPASPRLLRGLGRCCWMLGEPRGAIDAVRRAIELDPEDATGSYDLAVMLVRAGRSDEAVEFIDDALRIDPGLWNARALKAGILSDLGRTEEARRLFERALEDGAHGQAFWRAWLNTERAGGDSAAMREVLARMGRAERGGRQSP